MNPFIEKGYLFSTDLLKEFLSHIVSILVLFKEWNCFLSMTVQDSFESYNDLVPLLDYLLIDPSKTSY